jgi:hypothetical protein
VSSYKYTALFGLRFVKVYGMEKVNLFYVLAVFVVSCPSFLWCSSFVKKQKKSAKVVKKEVIDNQKNNEAEMFVKALKFIASGGQKKLPEDYFDDVVEISLEQGLAEINCFDWDKK